MEHNVNDSATILVNSHGEDDSNTIEDNIITFVDTMYTSFSVSNVLDTTRVDSMKSNLRDFLEYKVEIFSAAREGVLVLGSHGVVSSDQECSDSSETSSASNETQILYGTYRHFDDYGTLSIQEQKLLNNLLRYRLRQSYEWASEAHSEDYHTALLNVSQMLATAHFDKEIIHTKITTQFECLNDYLTKNSRPFGKYKALAETLQQITEDRLNNAKTDDELVQIISEFKTITAEMKEICNNFIIYIVQNCKLANDDTTIIYGEVRDLHAYYNENIDFLDEMFLGYIKSNPEFVKNPRMRSIVGTWVIVDQNTSKDRVFYLQPNPGELETFDAQYGINVISFILNNQQMLKENLKSNTRQYTSVTGNEPVNRRQERKFIEQKKAIEKYLLHLYPNDEDRNMRMFYYYIYEIIQNKIFEDSIVKASEIIVLFFMLNINYLCIFDPSCRGGCESNICDQNTRKQHRPYTGFTASKGGKKRKQYEKHKRTKIQKKHTKIINKYKNTKRTTTHKKNNYTFEIFK